MGSLDVVRGVICTLMGPNWLFKVVSSVECESTAYFSNILSGSKVISNTNACIDTFQVVF